MKYNAKEIAEQLGVKPNTARKWARDFQIPSMKSGHKIKFTEEALQVFETIKSLKDNGAGYNTIQRRIGPLSIPTESQNHPRDEQDVPESSRGHPEDTPDVRLHIEEAVTRAVVQQTELAERYAKASHYVGTLEERVHTLQAKLEEQNAQLRALPAPHEVKQLNDNHEALQQEKTALEAQLSQLEANLQNQLAKQNEQSEELRQVKTEIEDLTKQSLWQRLLWAFNPNPKEKPS